MAEAKKNVKKSPAKKAAKPVVKAALEPEVVETAVDEVKPEEVIKKAGKRSAKAIKEAEEKQAKEERKAAKNEPKLEEAKKAAKKPPRSRAERAGKKYRELVKLVDHEKIYTPKEAVELAIKTSPAKFDATVELHVNLGVDPTQSDQNVRGTVILPSGSGKNIRIAVLADSADAAKAKKAGANLAGEEEIFDLLDKEKLDFDTLITTPAMMPRLGKYARLLGPRGLMPNPKSGTVSADMVKAVTEAKAGRVEYRTDQAGIVHLGVGKASFDSEKLLANIDAALTSLRAARPSGVKGIYIKSAYLATTMGPSIKITPENT